MISMDEILMGRAKLADLPKDIQANLTILLERINKLRKAYGKPMKVNDGLRLVQGSGAPKSNHFKGLAIDLDDNEAGDLWKWVKENLQLLKDIGLWIEHPGFTHYKKLDQKGNIISQGSWMHFQVIPPGSGKRIFIPSTDANPNPTFWDGKYPAKFD